MFIFTISLLNNGNCRVTRSTTAGDVTAPWSCAEQTWKTISKEVFSLEARWQMRGEIWIKLALSKSLQASDCFANLAH